MSESNSSSGPRLNAMRVLAQAWALRAAQSTDLVEYEQASATSIEMYEGLLRHNGILGHRDVVRLLQRGADDDLVLRVAEHVVEDPRVPKGERLAAAEHVLAVPTLLSGEDDLATWMTKKLQLGWEVGDDRGRLAEDARTAALRLQSADAGMRLLDALASLERASADAHDDGRPLQRLGVDPRTRQAQGLLLGDRSELWASELSREALVAADAPEVWERCPDIAARVLTVTGPGVVEHLIEGPAGDGEPEARAVVRMFLEGAARGDGAAAAADASRLAASQDAKLALAASLNFAVVAEIDGSAEIAGALFRLLSDPTFPYSTEVTPYVAAYEHAKLVAEDDLALREAAKDVELFSAAHAFSRGAEELVTVQSLVAGRADDVGPGVVAALLDERIAATAEGPERLGLYAARAALATRRIEDWEHGRTPLPAGSVEEVERRRTELAEQAAIDWATLVASGCADAQSPLMRAMASSDPTRVVPQVRQRMQDSPLPAVPEGVRGVYGAITAVTGVPKGARADVAADAVVPCWEMMIDSLQRRTEANIRRSWADVAEPGALADPWERVVEDVRASPIEPPAEVAQALADYLDTVWRNAGFADHPPEVDGWRRALVQICRDPSELLGEVLEAVEPDPWLDEHRAAVAVLEQEPQRLEELTASASRSLEAADRAAEQARVREVRALLDLDPGTAELADSFEGHRPVRRAPDEPLPDSVEPLPGDDLRDGSLPDDATDPAQRRGMDEGGIEPGSERDAGPDLDGGI